jgi:microcystin-dependent protein
MVSTFTPALALEIPAHGDYAATGWDNPMDASLRTLDTAYGGMLNLPVTGGTTVLTTAQASNPIIYVTGTLTSNQIIAFPSTVAGRRVIIPACTMGNFALYVRGNAGADTTGVYFWIAFGIPYPIIVTPSRVYWDYGGCQPGTIASYPVGFAGNGWLPCDGRYVGQAQHDLLYSIIGGTWGVSGGNFKLPDYRGTVLAMADQIGIIPATGPYAFNAGNRGVLNSWGIATYAGEASHQISVAEMPGHNHPGSVDTGHTHGASQDAHNHTISPAQPGYGIGAQFPPEGMTAQGAMTTSTAQPNVYIATGQANISIAAQGSWAAHNNIQPTTTTMKMIKW